MHEITLIKKTLKTPRVFRSWIHGIHRRFCGQLSKHFVAPPDTALRYIYIMGQLRKTKQVWKSKPTLEGAGVHLKRAFGHAELPTLDPFLLLDDFHSQNPAEYLEGFPWHPHRGIETITYVLTGDVEHGDSLGNKGLISSGDVQWMTAGSGIIHQEMPKGDASGNLWGFQLWANLPASHKMMEPRYRDMKSSVIPEAVLAGDVRVRVICGAVGDVEGPVQDVVIEPEFLDVAVPPKTEFIHPVKRGHTVFAYVAEGEGRFAQERDHPQAPSASSSAGARHASYGAETLITYDDGDEIMVSTDETAVRFLLVSGKPLKEPIAWMGPIVMNTQEELNTAFLEYEKGTFIKHR